MDLKYIKQPIYDNVCNLSNISKHSSGYCDSLRNKYGGKKLTLTLVRTESYEKLKYNYRI